MNGLTRAALLACLGLIAAEPANAQFFNFFDDDTPRYSRPRAARGERDTPRRSQRAPQQHYRASSIKQFKFIDDDDEDDDRPQRRRATIGGTIKPPSAPRVASVIRDGGPRPSISPAVPGTVPFAGYAAGSVVIDSGGRSLYYVLADNRAYRYPIAVGREGFSWTGTESVSRKAAWPDWHPPREMRQRDPRLPEKMTGGLNNPLGAMAIYLGNTLYRIHGTNDARSIGSASSSGCFRMTNANVTHLAAMVDVGAAVHVVNRLPAAVTRSLAGL